MPESPELLAKLKEADLEVQQYVSALKAENAKLHKRIFKLEAENVSLENRIETIKSGGESDEPVSIEEAISRLSAVAAEYGYKLVKT